MPRQAEPRLSSVAVLDTAALSVLAQPRERAASARRAQAVLEAIERRGGYAALPAPVLAETSRTRSRRDATARVLRCLDVVPTDRRIAQVAGALLQAAALPSKEAIDAFVVATAAMHQSALVLTGDANELERLAAVLPNVAIQHLA